MILTGSVFMFVWIIGIILDSKLFDLKGMGGVIERSNDRAIDNPTDSYTRFPSDGLARYREVERIYNDIYYNSMCIVNT